MKNVSGYWHPEYCKKILVDALMCWYIGRCGYAVSRCRDISGDAYWICLIFQASVDHLQEMLDSQQEKVEALNSDLALKTRLVSHNVIHKSNNFYWHEPQFM